MADVKVQNREKQQESRGGALSRRGDMYTMNPFAMMRRLSEEMDRAFATSFGLPHGFGSSGEMAGWSPAVEVKERDGNLVVCAELPGLNKDDVKVEVNNDGLVIQGEKRREHEQEEGGWHRSERSYGHFYRLIPLPEGADAEKAHAEFKNGVLEVQVPVPEQEKKQRQIPIKS